MCVGHQLKVQSVMFVGAEVWKKMFCFIGTYLTYIILCNIFASRRALNAPTIGIVRKNVKSRQIKKRKDIASPSNWIKTSGIFGELIPNLKLLAS